MPRKQCNFEHKCRHKNYFCDFRVDIESMTMCVACRSNKKYCPFGGELLDCDACQYKFLCYTGVWMIDCEGTLS